MSDILEILTRAVDAEKIGRFAEALEFYETALAADLSNAKLRKKIGYIASRLSLEAKAIGAYREALLLDRADTATAASLADLLFDDDAHAAIAVLRESIAAAPNPVDRANGLQVLVRILEFSERQRRGLPISHVLSFDEFPFLFASDAVKEFAEATSLAVLEESSSPTSWHLHAFSAIAQRRYSEANSALAKVRELAPNYFEAALPLGAVPRQVRDLPPVTVIRPMESTGADRLLLCCDDRYFVNFALPLLRSIESEAPGSAAHIHLMSPNTAVLARASGIRLSLSATAEDPLQFMGSLGINPAHYYGSVRFVRFAQFLNVVDGRIWMLDVDAVAKCGPRRLFDIKADAALRFRAGRVEPHNQISACLVMGTPQSRSFFNGVANIISGALDRLWWGIDQFALFSAWVGFHEAKILPQIRLLGPSEAGVGDMPDDAAFWFTAGANKLRVLQAAVPDGGVGPIAKYHQRFQSFIDHGKL